MKIIYCILIILLTFFACEQPAENINETAALPENFQFEKMGLRAICSTINPKAGTTSILYGNNDALESLKNSKSSINEEKTLILVTWQQRNDPRWLGAKTPLDFLMMEILKTNEDFNEKEKISYVLHEGINFKANYAPDSEKRIDFITKIQPAVMP